MMAERGGAPAAADRHRRAARHRPALRRARGRDACTTSTTCRPCVARNLELARGGGAARAGDRRGGDPPLRPLARPARRAADGQRAARARQRDRRAGPRRELRALGVRLAARPRARRGDRAGGDEPPAARADDPPAQPQRATAATRASSSCASCSGCARTVTAGGATPAAELAEVHDRAPPPRALMRIGTRRSALALAQAQRTSPRLLGGCEIVPITTGGDRGAGDGRQVALGRPSSRRRSPPGEIDLAVHSAKDVPGELADGLVLLGAPARAGAEDVLCGAARPRASSPPARAWARAASGGSRSCAPRARISRWCRCAGNVDTRLRKLARRSSAATRSCSRAPGCSAWDARTRSARCSTRSASSRRRARARSRSGRAATTRAREAAARRSSTPARSPACSPSGRSRERSRRAATRRSARTRRSRRGASCGCAPGSGCPTGRPGSRDQLRGARAMPEALGARARRRACGRAGAGELLARAEEMASVGS